MRSVFFSFWGCHSIFTGFPQRIAQGNQFTYPARRSGSSLTRRRVWASSPLANTCGGKSDSGFYPSRRLGISLTHEVRRISPAHLGLYLITRQRVSYLRLDDIQCFALMIYRRQVADDIHAFGVIGMRIMPSLLHSALNRAIIKSEGRWRYELAKETFQKNKTNKFHSNASL